MKFMNAWDWAAGACKALGPNQAAAVANKEARDFIGSDNNIKNPNQPYFKNALNWILKRHPTALENKPQKSL